MATVKHLKNAPITEALIDFRAELPSGFDPESFEVLRERLADRYPEVKKRTLYTQRVEVRPESRHHRVEDRGLQGLRFESEDGRDLAQFRIDGFTFNRLKPYTSWEEVAEEARDLWALYCEIALPHSVTRVAVRYINQLPIPAQVDQIGEYITTPLPIPQGCSGRVASLLTKVVIRKGTSGLAANVIQGLEEDIHGRSLTIMLDIDAYKKREFGPQDEDIWSTLGDLRNLKNDIFFGSLTEKAVELFE